MYFISLELLVLGNLDELPEEVDFDIVEVGGQGDLAIVKRKTVNEGLTPLSTVSKSRHIVSNNMLRFSHRIIKSLFSSA